jgi:hypothetical protein
MRQPWSPSAGFLLALAGLLALGHAIFALTAAATKSMTADEIAHLTAGHAYNTRGDYRLQPENGNLPQRWAAVPLTLMGARLPDVATSAWPRSDVWNYGHEFFYRGALSADAALFYGRAMIALFSAATGLVIFLWSRALFSWRGAFLSLALFAFCPSFLAHGALATSDAVMTFFFVAAVGAWWRHLEQPGPLWASVSAGVLGLACVAKFSALLLAPMFALCAGVWLAGRVAHDGWLAPIRRLAASTLLHLAVAWAIIWIFYGLHFRAFAPDAGAPAGFYRGDWNWILTDIGWLRPLLDAARDWHLLPEAFLYGFAFVVQFARERAAFLNGHYSTTGWVSFFPFAFLVKTTLPFLIVCTVGAALAGVRGVRVWRDGRLRDLLVRLRPLTPLAALFAVYWASSLTSHLNIGHRHILPTYPVLFIAAGWLGRSLDLRRPLLAVTVAGLALWHAGEALVARPHYLAYFNPLAGGPAHGWRHLVDSSLDWGQDLGGLKAWLDTHAPKEKIYLAYFGTGDPRYEGINATLLPRIPEVGPERPWHALAPGVYAISATLLQHVYSSYRGEWTLDYEREFQRLLPLAPLLLDFQHDPIRRATLLAEAPAENWRTAWRRFEALRFARLCHYLRVRGADADVGHSILIFRLDATELAATTAGSAQAWERAIAAAVARRGVTGSR